MTVTSSPLSLLTAILKYFVKGVIMSKSLVSLNLHEILEPDKPSRDKIHQPAIQEMGNSLLKCGQLQPILVRRESNLYKIEAGHRRFLAARLIGWSVIDAIILDPTDEDSLHLERAHENLIREDLNPVEEARLTWDLVYEDGRGVDRTGHGAHGLLGMLPDL
ncbi:MAG: ParB/RepB/Spo0J family partition protein, partial [Patescibacteria group bacterium]